MARWGIDVSRWNKGLDLSKINNLNFIVIKAGGSDDGLYIDSQFQNFYTEAKSLGVPVGLYWYSKATSVDALKTELEYLLDRIKNMQFELPIFLDLEESVQYNVANKLAVYWLNELPQHGYYPAIYSSYSWWLDALKTVSCDSAQKWVALWGNYSDPGYDCGIWQNGAVTLQGMQVDSDYCYADYSFIQERGLNGFMDKQYFSDVTPDMSSYKAIEWMAKEGYIKGYPDGTFRPKENVTREQLCIILWRMAGRPE